MGIKVSFPLSNGMIVTATEKNGRLQLIYGGIELPMESVAGRVKTAGQEALDKAKGGPRLVYVRPNC